MRNKRIYLNTITIITITISIFFANTGRSNASAPDSLVPLCSVETLQQLEEDFQRMVQLHKQNPALFTQEEVKVAALNYVSISEQCYQATIPAHLQSQTDPIYIDEGGVWSPGYDPSEGDFSGQFVTHGTKWGSGSPFSGGYNTAGPGTSGGTVTYSYMANGVSHATESAGTNTHISGLTGYSSCFLTEISTAFAAWSAVANIQFVEVADNGVASDGSGAVGDIRIGAHAFDGPNGVLAHAYFPPPNGTSIAGDLHFDTGETWSCTTSGGFDIGFVALHEIGHSIGLSHETVDLAVMRPTYNASLTGLLQDDIDGAIAIYGAMPILSVSIATDPHRVISTTNTISYTLVAQNSGSAAATEVVITNTIPTSTTYVGGSASDSGSEVSSGIIVWPAITMSTSSSATRTFRVTINPGVNKGDLLINTVSMTSNEGAGVSNQQYISIYDPYVTFLPVLLKNN